jgi:uncharacterized protein (TIGR00255 family)
MTGFAQVKGQVNAGLSFALALKSVNHRFLDLHFRLPSDTDALEMKLRRLLKEKLARGHLEVALSLEYSGSNVFQSGYSTQTTPGTIDGVHRGPLPEV